MIINNPTIRAVMDKAMSNDLYFKDLPVKDDKPSVERYCFENHYTLSSYTGDGGVVHKVTTGRAYNYWDTTTNEWKNSFGYDSLINKIIIK